MKYIITESQLKRLLEQKRIANFEIPNFSRIKDFTEFLTQNQTKFIRAMSDEVSDATSKFNTMFSLFSKKDKVKVKMVKDVFKDNHLEKDSEDYKKQDFNFSLTSIGTTKVNTLNVSKPQLEILSIIDEEGAISVSDISERLGVSFNKTKELLNKLIRAGYIKKVN